ncbi:hypothetical protein [Saccharomonospora piscinae]|uniref:hypothetical protein n=1 Tax=Saccharomonospora piscinae TaxID=687388 RepID=UPI001FC8FA8B|nr:hypothetical protein [Saccharomonospora piscinae]
MTTYVVSAKRWARGWELHIEGVGVTQVRSLSSAEATAREYIAFALDLDDEHAFEIDVVPELAPELTREIRDARERTKRAALMQREAAAQQRELAKKLHRDGLAGREIAALLEVTPQRVSQILGKPVRKLGNPRVS